MPKKKKKESWKEQRQRAALKHQKALEAERLRSETEPKKEKGWSRSKVLGIAFLVVLLLVVGVYAAWQNTQPASNNRQPAPLFTLTDLDGNAISLGNLTGKVVVLDFFATWCQPCLQEIPHLAQINENYDSSNVVVLSIGSSGDSESDLRQFRDEHKMNWAVARDTDGALDKYNVMYIPTLVIVDQEGYIYYRNKGVTEYLILASNIDILLYD
jgi:cytochrome c biogenesis protein CcmG/thiol:disulfide interchange protein DsbE